MNATMKVCSIFFLAITLIEVVLADFNSINHDKVKPFAQPKPVTIEEKAAIKFKPQLHISYGCQPYPAVQANGAVSAGLKWSGSSDGECQGSELGSQVYARTSLFKGKFAIMYAWYFPKGYQGINQYKSGHRHLWRFVIVWIDDPAARDATILGVSMHADKGYGEEAPPESSHVDGDSVKMELYKSGWHFKAALRLTEKKGDMQDLILWDQLTEKARAALNGDAFDIELPLTTIENPLKDDVFTETLEKAWPF